MSSVNSILSSYPYVKVVQRFQALEAITQGIFEQPNRYDVFGGNDAESATVPLLLAEEKSEGCTRCCCAPCHSTLVLVKSPNEPRQVLMTLERPGTECFTNGCGPKPLLCCFACTDGCTDEVVIHDGEVQGRPGDMGSGVARISQPIGGGGFTPTLFVTGSDQNVAGDGVITGPCCLGGCLELCLDTNFKYHREEKGEQIGTIIHLRPPCCTSACLTELCTDSDKFGMDMINSFKPENKAKALAALLLIDYMFFERDNGIIACRPAGGGQSGCTLQITLFLCYCYGCLIPCNLSIPLHKSDE